MLPFLEVEEYVRVDGAVRGRDDAEQRHQVGVQDAGLTESEDDLLDHVGHVGHQEGAEHHRRQLERFDRLSQHFLAAHIEGARTRTPA